MSNLYHATKNDGETSVSTAGRIDIAIEKPMSIKDRIRAMNLIAEKSMSHNTWSQTSSSRPKFSNYTGRPLTLEDRTMERNPHQQRKPIGLSSDPGVGNDGEKEAATKAINKWRNRRGEETAKSVVGGEKDIVEDDKDKIEWTIFDLTKGSRKNGSVCVSVSPVPKAGVGNTNEKGVLKVIPSRNGTPTNLTSTPMTENTHSGRKSPAASLGSFHHPNNTLSEFGFVMPKLKPVRRAPRTLELVNQLTSPRKRVETEEKSLDNNDKHHREIESDSDRKELKESPKQSITLKKIERNENADKGAVYGEQKEANVNVAYPNNVAHVPQNYSTSINSHIQTIDNKVYLKLNPNESMSTKKKVGTPQRSKISDRIKAFSSAANGSSWKQQSPARNLVLPPASSHSSLAGKKMIARDVPHQGEDSSCASSEKQSIDEDSISVSTPMANSTPARLGAQPPTPNSYNSEAAYTSVASSGDGAVAGSFASSEQNMSSQMQYAHVSTPSSSVQDDNSTASPKYGQVILTKPGPKNALQSKLEYDKQRAVRRLKMSKRRMKVPTALVAAQKKAQDQESHPKWGIENDIPSNDSTPQRPCANDTHLLTTVSSSLDADPTIQEQTLEPVLTDTRIDSPKDMSSGSMMPKGSPPLENANLKAKNDENVSVKHGQMKAEVMKQLINKRRRRRKENQNAKRDLIVENKVAMIEHDEGAIPLIKRSSSSSKSLPRMNDVNKNVKIPVSVKDTKREPSVSTIIQDREKSQSTKCSADELLNEGLKAVSDETLIRLDTIKRQGTRDKNHPPVKSSTDGKSAFNRLTDITPGESRLPSKESPVLERVLLHVPYHGDNGTVCAPPLPPEIIRSIQKEEVQERGNVNTSHVSCTEEAVCLTSQISNQARDSVPNSPSNSVSVASSLFQDYPDDEDEPEPVVDSFIDEELSPIRSHDISKHDFDTSTSYRGSPESAVQQVKIPRQARDSTPKRANRHITYRSIERYLHSPTSAHNTSNLACIKSLNLSNVDLSSSHLSGERETYAKNSKSSLATQSFDHKSRTTGLVTAWDNHNDDDAHFSETSSDIRPSPTSSVTSSTVSSMASRANRILLERRSKFNKRMDPGAASTHERHAADLARKIMKDSYQEKLDDDLRDDKVRDKSELHETSTVLSVSSYKGARSQSEIVPSVNSVQTETTKETNSISRHEHDTKSCDYTSSDLDLDVDQIDTSTESEGYAKSSERFTCLAMTCCNQNFGNSEDSLNFSAMSAVRISQETDEDVPFDEEAGAIEVEYIPNENIASVSKANDANSSILMHVGSKTIRNHDTYFTSSPNVGFNGKDRPLFNYVSESSEDISDDIGYPTLISSTT